LSPREAVLGDSWHRYYVRMLEAVQSMKLIRQGIEKYRAAKGNVGEPIKLKAKLPKGTAYVETEAPKGQMGFLIVSDGQPVPWRVRIRSSSFCNLSVIGELCRGGLIAEGTPGEVTRDPLVVEAYLGHGAASRIAEGMLAGD